VLFIDARNIFTQIDRAHREFNPNQLLFIASLARLYRGEDLNGYQLNTTDLNLVGEQMELVQAAFAEDAYNDVLGLCSVAIRDQIEKQDWSLNPGRYVGAAVKYTKEVIYQTQMKSLKSEFFELNEEAHDLEETIVKNLNSLLD